MVRKKFKIYKKVLEMNNERELGLLDVYIKLVYLSELYIRWLLLLFWIVLWGWTYISLGNFPLLVM